MDHPVYVALQGIDAAIAKVRAPTGTLHTFSPDGMSEGATYQGTPAELEEVVEDLIGAAFVLAHTHLKATGKPFSDVVTVANYWKHRDDWGATWSKTSRWSTSTIEAVESLGFSAPVAPDQLTALAAKVLGRPFSGEVLWQAIM